MESWMRIWRLSRGAACASRSACAWAACAASCSRNSELEEDGREGVTLQTLACSGVEEWNTCERGEEVGVLVGVGERVYKGDGFLELGQSLLVVGPRGEEGQNALDAILGKLIRKI